jgi:hypothetical protein
MIGSGRRNNQGFNGTVLMTSVSDEEKYQRGYNKTREAC